MLSFVETSKIAEKSALKALRVTTQAPGTGALEQLSNYLRCFTSSLRQPPSLYHSFPLPLPHARALSPSLPLSLPLILFLSTSRGTCLGTVSLGTWR